MRDRSSRPRTVSLASDRRARVPFAVIGVLMLVVSVSAVTLSETNPEPQPDLDTEQAMDAAVSSSQAALRTAVRDAASKVAKEPLSETADTIVGNAISDASPSTFKNYLRLRIYLQAQRELEGYRQRVANRTYSTVSLSPVDYTEDSLEQAIGDVELTTSSESSDLEQGELQVTFDGLEASVIDSGTEAASKTQSMTLTVGTPIFTIRNDVQRYETLLEKDFWSSSGINGFGRKFAGFVYIWSYFKQSYERYQSLPGPSKGQEEAFANILRNQELGVFANTVNLLIQQKVFDTRAQGSTQQLAGGYLCLAANAAKKLVGTSHRYSQYVDTVCAAGQAILSGESLGENFRSRLRSSGAVGLLENLQSEVNDGSETASSQVTIESKNVSDPAYHEVTDQYYNWDDGADLSEIDEDNKDAIREDTDEPSSPDFTNSPDVLDAVIEDVYTIDPSASTGDVSGGSPDLSTSPPSVSVGGWDSSSTTSRDQSVEVNKQTVYDDNQYQQDRRLYEFEITVTSEVTKDVDYDRTCPSEADEEDCDPSRTADDSDSDTVTYTTDIYVSAEHSIGTALDDLSLGYENPSVDALGIENVYTDGGDESSGTANTDFDSSAADYNLQPALAEAVTSTIDPVSSLSGAKSTIKNRIQNGKPYTSGSGLQSQANGLLKSPSPVTLTPNNEAQLKTWLTNELEQTNRTLVSEVGTVTVDAQEMVTGSPFEMLRDRVESEHSDHDFVYRGASRYASVPDKTLALARRAYLDDVHDWIDEQSETREQGVQAVNDEISDATGGSGSASGFFSFMDEFQSASLDLGLEPSASYDSNLQGENDINYRIHSSPGYLTKMPVSRAAVSAVRPEGEVPEDPENTIYSTLAVKNDNALPNPGFPIIPWPSYWYASVNFWDISVKGEFPRFAVSASSGSPATVDGLTYVRQGQPVHVKINGLKRTAGSVEPINFESDTFLLMAMPGATVMPKGGWGAGDRIGSKAKYSLEQCSKTWDHLGPGFNPTKGSGPACSGNTGGGTTIASGVMPDAVEDATELADTLDDIEDGEIGDRQLCGESAEEDDDSLVSPGGLGLGAGQGVGVPGGALADEDDEEGCDDSKLIVEFLDVGKGTSILVTRQTGEDCGCDDKHMLIDTGPAENRVANRLDDRDIETLDSVVLTHNHSDHLSGLKGLLDEHNSGDLEIQKLYHNGLLATDSSGDLRSSQEDVMDKLDGSGIDGEKVTSGTDIDLGGEVDIDVLNPPDTYRTGCNKQLDCNSIVLRITKDSETFLLPADIRADVEEDLADEFGSADVLQLAHHGSASANSEDLLDVDPDIAVITTGKNWPPRDSVISDLTDLHIPVYATEMHGHIKFVVDEEGDLDGPDEAVYDSD